MKKWMWVTVPVATLALGLVIWGGAVFAQESPKVAVTRSVNGTGMDDYCQNATGIMGTAGVMNHSGMMGASVNGTDMYEYCQNATGMMGSGGMMGGTSLSNINMNDYCQNASGMMGDGGMMGAGGMMNHSGMMGR